ncbi:hypothetical protein [Candidatus Palauibacter sp.]|uniref:hypothetical protein n=1 Tax=Candidatus Palauibacter sp. TaxID=3101350 RepID=UPI003C6EB28F
MVSTLALVALVATPLGAQEVVESAAPRDADLTLTDEPLVRIGLVDGPLDYIFGDVTGAVRLDDGSIVVADEQSHNVRRYDADGRHLWTSGREGDGPGEYRGLRLLRNCPGAAITVFDWVLDRITELDSDGNVVDTRALNSIGVRPYGEPACSPDRGLVFTPWPEDQGSVLDRAVGESWRWRMSLRYAQGGRMTVLRSGIPGAERTRISRTSARPSHWGRDIAFAAVDAGAWYGTSDDYELEHLDWTGRVTRIARWAGPGLAVTDEQVDRYRDYWWDYLLTRDPNEERSRFEREVWPEVRAYLPERFPAYESLLALADGSIWIRAYRWRAPGEELHLLDRDGVWIRRLTMPSGSVLLDAGPDWVLISQRDEFDVPTVALYKLVETGG